MQNRLLFLVFSTACGAPTLTSTPAPVAFEQPPAEMKPAPKPAPVSKPTPALLNGDRVEPGTRIGVLRALTVVTPYDRVLGTPCEMKDGACTPTAPAIPQRTVFSDDACTEAAALVPKACTEPTLCGRYTSDYRPLTETSQKVVYELAFDVCLPMTVPADRVAVRAGDKAPLVAGERTLVGDGYIQAELWTLSDGARIQNATAAFTDDEPCTPGETMDGSWRCLPAGAERASMCESRYMKNDDAPPLVEQIDGDGRVRVRRYMTEAGFALTGSFFDSEMGVTCTPALVDGEPVCAPVTTSTIVYADSNCEFMRVMAPACETSNLAIAAAAPGIEVYKAGDATVAPAKIYERIGARCIESEAPEGSKFFEVLQYVEATDLAELRAVY